MTEKALEVYQPRSISAFCDIKSFENAQRMAALLTQSKLIPEEFQDNIPDCMLAIELAMRIGMSPLMVLQNIYFVSKKPGFSAQFLIGMINSCGRFSPVRYEIEQLGEKEVEATYLQWVGNRNEIQTRKITIKDTSCHAWVKEKATGDKLIGPTVSIAMAAQEGWYLKKGSKWVSMPEVMLRYRAATLFSRLYAPELTMGMQTVEEIIDVEVHKSTEIKVDDSTTQLNEIFGGTDSEISGRENAGHNDSTANPVADPEHIVKGKNSGNGNGVENNDAEQASKGRGTGKSGGPDAGDIPGPAPADSSVNDAGKEKPDDIDKDVEGIKNGLVATIQAIGNIAHLDNWVKKHLGNIEEELPVHFAKQVRTAASMHREGLAQEFKELQGMETQILEAVKQIRNAGSMEIWLKGAAEIFEKHKLSSKMGESILSVANERLQVLKKEEEADAKKAAAAKKAADAKKAATAKEEEPPLPVPDEERVGTKKAAAKKTPPAEVDYFSKIGKNTKMFESDPDVPGGRFQIEARKNVDCLQLDRWRSNNFSKLEKALPEKQFSVFYDWLTALYDNWKEAESDD